MSISTRFTLIAIVSTIRDTPCIHFTSSPLQGSNANLWLPIDVNNLFASVEQLLCINHIAHNVVNIEYIAQSETYFDIRITCNALSTH